MKLSYVLIIVGILSILLSSISFGYFNQYTNLVGLALSFASLIIGIIWEIENRKFAQLSLDENRLQHLDIINKIDTYEKQITQKQGEVDKLTISNTKLKQLMNKISNEIKKEHLSKEKIIKRISKPIYGLLLFKGHELDKDGSEAKPLRDNILPSLGFNHLTGCKGTYLLPPSKLPPFENKQDLEKWISKNIYDKIPSNFRYVIPYIQLIDLRFNFSKKKDDLTKKNYGTILDSVNVEDLLNFTESLNYLQKKKSISLKDIIEIPHVFFLADNTSLSKTDLETLKQNDENIIKALEKKIGAEIFTKDFVKIEDNILKTVIEEHIHISNDDIKIIKQNAKFWVDLIDNNLSTF